VAEAIVELPRLRLGQDLVGLGRLPKALLRFRVVGDVRVKLARQPPECGFDLFVGRAALDSEDVVVVALRARHGQLS
jgi:hypothetical protein